MDNSYKVKALQLLIAKAEEELVSLKKSLKDTPVETTKIPSCDHGMSAYEDCSQCDNESLWLDHRLEREEES